MRRFLVESDFSTVQEFAQHFLGPSALDADGRSVLFYTSAEDVPRLVAAGANLEQRDDADFTPLMAAAYKCDVPLVSALLEAGCNLTALGGKAVKRNAVHFAIMAHQKELNKETQTSPVEAVVGVLLEKATAQKNMDELLAVPGAEHTPFMLAAQIGAPEAVVRTLAKHSPAESLIRRDSQLKTALHLSVTRVPEPAIKSFEAVLEATGTCTSMEDARGCTPYDAAKNTVTASVWKAPSKPQRAHTRRVEWPAKDEAHESVSAWQCCGHLHEAIRSVPGHRTLASFEEVQEAAKGAAEKAQADEKAAAAPYHHNRSAHTEQVSPADVNLLDIMWSRGSNDFPMMS